MKAAAFDLRTHIRDKKGVVVQVNPYSLKIENGRQVFKRGPNYFNPDGTCIRGPLKVEQDAMEKSRKEAQEAEAATRREAEEQQEKETQRQLRALEMLDEAEGKLKQVDEVIAEKDSKLVQQSDEIKALQDGNKALEARLQEMEARLNAQAEGKPVSEPMNFKPVE